MEKKWYIGIAINVSNLHNLCQIDYVSSKISFMLSENHFFHQTLHLHKNKEIILLPQIHLKVV